MLEKVIKKYKDYNNNRVVCSCFRVTKSDIEKAVYQGSTSVNEVRKNTKAGMGCGRCNASVENITYKALKNSKDK